MNRKFLMKIFSQYFFFAFLFLVFFSGCKKDKNEIPDVPVDLYIYTTDPAFSPLNAIQGSQYFTGGSKGILVYRASQNEFVSYDRHCTYQVSEGNTVSVDASVLVTDPVCGSKFHITDGSVNQGPAVTPLKRYQTSFDGTVLHIYN